MIALLKYFRELEERTGFRIRTDVFLTHGAADRLDHEARAHGARLFYARYSRKSMPAFIASWRAVLHKGDYQVIHDHQEFTAGWHFLFGLGLLPPVRIAHLHNPIGHQDSYSRDWLRRQTIRYGNLAIAKLATHLLSTSRQLIEEQGFDELKAAKSLTIKALHCGFDTSRFLGNRKSVRAGLRSELGLAPAARIMLFAGRLDSNQHEGKNQKNPGFCLEVARICAERDPAFTCLIAGGGCSMIKRLKEKVNSWGLGRRILFLGTRSDVPRLMMGSDVLILPSIGEGLGMVAVEAQAAGLRIIASTAVPRECSVVPGAVEFVPLSDGVDHWADRVSSALRQTRLNHEGANRLVAHSPFSIQSSASELLRIYQGVDRRAIEAPKKFQ